MDNTTGLLDETTTPPAISDIAVDDIGDELETAYLENTVQIQDGQIINGKVVKIEAHEVLIGIGYKSEGVIPLKELAVRQDVHPSELVSIGEDLEAVVIQKEDREGRLVLSKKRAQYEKVWKQIDEIQKEGKAVKGVAIEVVKGGLIVDIGLRGFLPASLVDLRRVSNLEQFVGQEIEAKILELDRARSNVVLSRRAYLEESHKEERVELMGNLMPGEVKKGTISSVVSFGAFVDLGGMDGLVHVSELSWKHIDHPNEVVAVGDEVEVRVLGVDASRERIALSLKATQQGPWSEFAETHNVGELVYGRVTKLVPFGAFIQVGDDIEGLVHISEISSHRVERPEEVISPNEELWVKIVEIDVSKRRISLSIKQALEGGEVAAAYQGEYADVAETAVAETAETQAAETQVASEEVVFEESLLKEEPKDLKQEAPSKAEAEPPKEEVEAEPPKEEASSKEPSNKEEPPGEDE